MLSAQVEVFEAIITEFSRSRIVAYQSLISDRQVAYKSLISDIQVISVSLIIKIILRSHL